MNTKYEVDKFSGKSNFPFAKVTITCFHNDSVHRMMGTKKGDHPEGQAVHGGQPYFA